MAGPATGWISTGRLQGGSTVTPRDWFPGGFFGRSAPGAAQLSLAGSTGMTGLAGVSEVGVGRGFSSAQTIQSGTADNPATIRATQRQGVLNLESNMNAAYAEGDQAGGDYWARKIRALGLNPENVWDEGYQQTPIGYRRGPETVYRARKSGLSGSHAGL